MATIVITPPLPGNTTSALAQVNQAYQALNVAMRNLLDDQGTLTPAPTAGATPPITSIQVGFETIDKEIKLLYSAIAMVTKVHSRIARRQREQAATAAASAPSK